MAWLDKNGQTGHVAGYFSPFGDRFGRTCVWLAADPRRVHGCRSCRLIGPNLCASREAGTSP